MKWLHLLESFYVCLSWFSSHWFSIVSDIWGWSLIVSYIWADAYYKAVKLPCRSKWSDCNSKMRSLFLRSLSFYHWCYPNFLTIEYSCSPKVGLSGSGKSTLLNLLLRLYEPSNGQVNDLHLSVIPLQIRIKFITKWRSYIVVIN